MRSHCTEYRDLNSILRLSRELTVKTGKERKLLQLVITIRWAATALVFFCIYACYGGVMMSAFRYGYQCSRIIALRVVHFYICRILYVI